MDAFVELLKPCLVLLGPLLFFAFKRLSELQGTNKLQADSLAVQDFVEKLTKTPLHMTRCRRIFKKEKRILFEREKHLQCKCKALQSRLQYELSKNEYLNSLYVDQVFRQGESLKENFYLKVTVKKLRKHIEKQRKYSMKVRCQANYFHDYQKACTFRCQQGHVDSYARACGCSFERNKPRNGFYEPLHEELVESESEETEEIRMYDDNQETVNGDFLQFNSTERLIKSDHKFNYYQTYFS